jgi:transposase
METREAISLDDQAQRRLRVLNHLLEGAISAEQAATILGRSVRQVRRLLAAYRARGAAALVHGNRGRRAANRLADEHRERVIGLATTRYGGLNREHTAELLAEEEGLAVAPRTLRRWLSDEGMPTVRRRRAPRHRSRRERMAQAGLLLQVDGSRHDWLGGRGPLLTLVGGIDDATGLVTGATFRDQEDAAGYFALLVQTVRRHGRPMAIYSDRHGIFWRDPARPATLAEELAGKRSLTQVGRALDDAGIAWIPARSPQAKGRVERLWGPSRTASWASYDWAARTRSRVPTPSSVATLPATTGASWCRRSTSGRPGESGRWPSRPRPYFASPTRVG